ncbi:Type I transmembrane sorting receptor [Tulasnella sp. 427]|nr:Type I transmembrane sorting receptor [Tulasnella sp. 427]
MVHFSILSATTGILASISLVATSPVPSNEPLKAGVIPFTNQHAVIRSAANFTSSDLWQRDLYRMQKRNELLAARRKRSTFPVVRGVQSAKAVATEPFDIGRLRQLRKRQSSEANPLTNEGDGLYYGGLTVGGQPPTTINFDTGSSDLLVPTVACQSCTGPFYNSSASQTYKFIGPVVLQSFADKSSARGPIVSDTVSLGTLSVSNQVFVAVEEATKHPAFDGPNAGLMGLAFTAGATTEAKPWFINLADQGALASNVFSFYLSRQEATGSELCIGCIDSTKYAQGAQIKYFPLTPGDDAQEYWDIQAEGFTYNGTVVTGSMKATIDSGTSLIWLPDNHAQALYNAIPDAKVTADGKHWTFPCAKANTIGEIGIVFTGSTTVFKILPSQFNAGPVSPGSDICKGAVISNGSDPENTATVGDAFMSSWYTVFNYETKSVGFAPAV